jgi:diaminohydroxyphosphoribosylaminopyrimidine deaminase/5-amino-6-(5-phosphoribosylamino)uracil reductase
MDQSEIDLWHMRRALALAAQGQGYVEPNPMVGCVIARGAEIIGEGWHRRFGEAHAEVEALHVAGDRAAGGTLYVTLEPCCHVGKTPPCTRAILAAGIRRVVAAMRDPFPAVSGGGLAELAAAGVEVEVGLLEADARRLNAPYLKLVGTGRPWIIAKWAMTLDGKLATHTGESQWISNAESRAIVHALRGRVDAIIVGRETAVRDDPLLTARPPGPRTALRIVLDTQASLGLSGTGILPVDSSTGILPVESAAGRMPALLESARETPVLVAVAAEADEARRKRLTDAGCEVFVCVGETHSARLESLLDELGRRRMTNVLVEGGGRLFGTLLDARLIDEVHAFIAPKLLGGAAALTPLAGEGIARMSDALLLDDPLVRQLGSDVYVSGRLHNNDP